MPSKTLYASISGVSNIQSIDVIESYSSFSNSASIVCRNSSLGVGDAISIDAGYSDDHGTIFTGYVKEINDTAPNGDKTLTCYDELIKAADYFMAPTDPDNPFTRSNIDAKDLVEDLLGEASITNFTGSTTSFVFTEPSFSLVKVSEAIEQINGIIAWHCWADENGLVHFEDRKPYVMGGDSSSFSFTTGSSGNIITAEYERSERELRNRVTVYGQNPIVATSSAASPYLPAGFYKTAVVASPLITSQQQAEDSADYNLTLYNRLTQRVQAEALGDYELHANAVITVTEGNTGISGDWFVEKASHSWSSGGYTMRLGLKA